MQDEARSAAHADAGDEREVVDGPEGEAQARQAREGRVAVMSEDRGPGVPLELVMTRPEGQVAADLKRRFEEALEPVCWLMDEAAQSGLQVQWENFTVGPPTMRHRINGLRVAKYY